MLTEGKGLIAPGRVPFKVSRNEIVVLLTEAQRRASFRGYKNRSSTWSRGLVNGIEIPGVGVISQDIRPILCGMIGEHAIVQTINNRLNRIECELDCDLLHQGDGGKDIEACGKTVQVKTRTSQKFASLVDRVRAKRRQSRRLIPFKSSHYVFCEWVPNKDPFTVQILGWIHRRSLSELPFIKSNRGDWFNIVVSDSVLEPFGRFIQELRNS